MNNKKQEDVKLKNNNYQTAYVWHEAGILFIPDKNGKRLCRWYNSTEEREYLLNNSHGDGFGSYGRGSGNGDGDGDGYGADYNADESDGTHLVDLK